MSKKLENSEFEDKIIEVEISDEPSIGMQVFGPMGMEDIGMNIKDMISSSLPKNKRSKKMKVKEAREVLPEKEMDNNVPQQSSIPAAVPQAVQQEEIPTKSRGITFGEDFALDALEVDNFETADIGGDVLRLNA
mgnify:CR=1 FL=1